MPKSISEVIKAKPTPDAARNGAAYTEKMGRANPRERAGKAERSGKINPVALATLKASAPSCTRKPTQEEVKKANGSPILAAIVNAYRAANGERT